jgi:hypothetical protein
MKLNTLAVSPSRAPIAPQTQSANNLNGLGYRRAFQGLCMWSTQNRRRPPMHQPLLRCGLFIGIALVNNGLLAQTSPSSIHAPAVASSIARSAQTSSPHPSPTSAPFHPLPPYRVPCVLSTEVFARNQCSLSRGRHGQWVRGSANLLWNDHLNIQLGLETDSTFFGIGGHVEFDLLDAQGHTLYHGSTGEATIPGKKPGKARIWLGVWNLASVPHDVAMKTQSIRVKTVVQDDNAPEPWGLTGWSATITMNTPNG